MKKLLTFLACGLLMSVGAQEMEAPDNYNTGMFPRTPDAVTLAKLIDIPSGNYTGISSFSIPIYTIDFYGNQLPINITYSTAGIKVGEIASRVGLGWVLNAGGVTLSRQIVGFPDAARRPIVTDIPNYNPDGPPFTDNDNEIAREINGATSSDLTMMFHPNDMKPDLYSYSTLNGSGKFIFDSSENFGIPLPYNQTKITHNGLDVNIIDEKGMVYEFKNYLNTRNRNTCVSSVSPISNFEPDYKIQKIVNTNGHQITFKYDKFISDVNYITSISEQKRVVYFPSNGGGESVGNYPNLCINYSDIRESILSSINFPGGKILFLYNDEVTNTVREDITGDVYLKRVKVLNELGETIRDVSLNYEYFISPQAPSHIPRDLSITQTMRNDIYKRLKLKEVVDNLTSSKYQLTYYEDKTLPHRLSYSQDFWGVYNGKNNFKTSIPTSRYRHYISLSEIRERLFYGADKSPDFDFGVMGNLKELKYPTGGSTTILYEPDDYYVHENKKYDYTYNAEYISSTQSPPETTFTMSGQAYELELQHTGTNDTGDHQTDINNCKLQIFNAQNQSVYSIQQYGTFQLFDSLAPGTFTNLGTGDLGEGTPVCTGRLEWYEESTSILSNNKKAGTLRVKQIILNDNNSEIKRDFIYRDSINLEQSSGINHGDELNFPITRSVFPINKSGKVKDLLILSNSPGLNLNTIGGKSIGYSTVYEVYMSDNEKFKKRYIFSNELDNFYTPFVPYQLINYRYPNLGLSRGLLKSETLFNSSNEIVRDRKLSYIFDYHNNALSTASIGNILMYTLDVNIRSIVCLGSNCIYKYYWRFLPIQNMWIQNVTTTITDYVNGNPTMITEQITGYSPTPPKHTFPITQTTTNSLGEVLKTEYQYPHDLLGQKPLMDSLVAANRIATPIITKTSNGNTPLSVQETVYAKDASTNQFILPKYVYAKKEQQV